MVKKKTKVKKNKDVTKLKKQVGQLDSKVNNMNDVYLTDTKEQIDVYDECHMNSYFHIPKRIFLNIFFTLLLIGVVVMNAVIVAELNPEKFKTVCDTDKCIKKCGGFLGVGSNECIDICKEKIAKQIHKRECGIYEDAGVLRELLGIYSFLQLIVVFGFCMLAGISAWEERYW